MGDWLRGLWASVLAIWRRQELRRGLDEELASHIAMAIEDEIRRGAAEPEARRRVLLRFGQLDEVRAQHREAAGWPRVESVIRDVRDAGRLLRRNPGFALLAISSLALGIGANTAVFSILSGLLLRPLPVKDPGSLVQLLSGPTESAWTFPLWEQLESRRNMFGGLAAWSATNLTPVNWVEDGALTPLAVSWASGDLFDVLGLTAQRGRLLGPADEQLAGQGTVNAVLSDRMWRTRFASDDEVIGQVLTLNRFRVRVVGVAPAEFLGPEVGSTFDIALPIRALPPLLLRQRTFWWVHIWARLKPGQTPATLASALQAIQPDLRSATLPVEQRADIRDAYLTAPLSAQSVSTGHSNVRGQYREPLMVLMAGVALLLLIGCVNLTNLLLARGEARRREIALRLALGASRTRLIRQLLIESLAIAGTGALAGLVVAWWLSHLLLAQLDGVTLAIPLDWRVLLFAAMATTLTALAIGVLPAVRATAVAPQTSLAEGNRTLARPQGRASATLVIIQLAVSLVLLAGAVLLTRTFVALTRADLGFDPDPVIAVAMTLRPGSAWGTDEVMQELLNVVKAVPGVEAASFSGLTTPMSGLQHNDYLENPPEMNLSTEQRDVFFRDAGVGWFRTLGMRFVAGRDFAASDAADPRAVAVVNETLARRFFPGQPAVGQVLRAAGSTVQPGGAMTVVGVVNDSIYNSARGGVRPTLYRFVPTMTVIVVRAANGDPTSIVRNVTEAVTGANAGVFVSTRLLRDQADATTARERLVAMVSGVFGGLAVALAGVGLYGLVSYSVGRRRREIGVRRALGAPAGSIVRLIIGHAAALLVAGAIMGLFLCLLSLRFVSPLLYDLQPLDPGTLLGAAGTLVSVGLFAAWLPTCRALRIHPAEVLRE